MFKRMLSMFGVGGPSVDTVLDSPHAIPGQVITGQVRIEGGSTDARIDRIVLSLVTRAEAEHGDHESHGTAEFFRLPVAENVLVAEGQPVTLPFELPLPWETPITAVGGRQLPGMTVGVRTELDISGAPDKGDLDPIQVSPTPAQDAVLEAFGQLGFQFHSADVEAGRIHGVRQELGFFQEIEFFPPHRYAGRINQVELTFVTNPHELVVILEADKRGGLFRTGGDSFGRFHVSLQDALTTDWASWIDQWMAQTAERGGHFGHDAEHEHHGHHRGPGMGGIVAGAAVGVVGGMVLGEVIDEGLEEVFEDE
jgi:sporulation-control protein